MAKIKLKYPSRMTELGLTDSNINDDIRFLIKSMNNAEDALQNAVSDKEREEVESDIVVLDGDIIKALEKRRKNLDLAKKMQEGRKAKQNSSKAESPSPEPTPSPSPEPTPSPSPEPIPTPEEKKEEEKDGGGGFLGVLALLGLGALAVFGLNKIKNG